MNITESVWFQNMTYFAISSDTAFWELVIFLAEYRRRYVSMSRTFALSLNSEINLFFSSKSSRKITNVEFDSYF